ncbi:MAG: hypothetical protein JWN35_3673 [Frankiales bacterium]|nr:hypothetical protein [Frankiales bacterium]
MPTAPPAKPQAKKQAEKTEPDEGNGTDQPLPPAVRLGNRLLGTVEDVIYVSIAALLAIGAIIVTIRSAIVLWDRSTRSGDDVMLDVLDSLLLVFIFVELLYAVRTTLAERQIVAEPFLIAGILASIKEILLLSVKAANEYLPKGPEFARAMVELGLLGALILLLSVAIVLLRVKEKQPAETTGG